MCVALKTYELLELVFSFKSSPRCEKSESILLPHSSWSLGVTWPRGASRRASLHRVAKATMLYAASLDGAVC